jgi:hypothetical protein
MAKNLLQAVAIVCLAALCAMIAHKGYADVSLLAPKHSAIEFWVAFGRYLIANIAGG